MRKEPRAVQLCINLGTLPDNLRLCVAREGLRNTRVNVLIRRTSWNVMLLIPDSSRFRCLRHRIDGLNGWFRKLRAHSCQRSHQFASHHREIGQRKQRVQLRGVLGQGARRIFWTSWGVD
jgi:hypothetical protein